MIRIRYSVLVLWISLTLSPPCEAVFFFPPTNGSYYPVLLQLRWWMEAIGKNYLGYGFMKQAALYISSHCFSFQLFFSQIEFVKDKRCIVAFAAIVKENVTWLTMFTDWVWNLRDNRYKTTHSKNYLLVSPLICNYTQVKLQIEEKPDCKDRADSCPSVWAAAATFKMIIKDFQLGYYCTIACMYLKCALEV